MKEGWRDLVYAISFTSFVGSTFIALIFIGYFIGVWFDENYLTAPYGKMIGIIFSVGFASYSIYKHIRRYFLKLDKDK